MTAQKKRVPTLLMLSALKASACRLWWALLGKRRFVPLTLKMLICLGAKKKASQPTSVAAFSETTDHLILSFR